MIDPTFLASLRRQYNAQDLLLLVQLEQVAPTWWPNQEEMADQFGTERSVIYKSLMRLEGRGLIAKHASKRGTHVWWVRRHKNDKPDKRNAPAWVLRDMQSKWKTLIRVPVDLERAWCQKEGILFRTFQKLTYGKTSLLAGRWELAGHPWDYERL
jgi:hypothetical protein